MLCFCGENWQVVETLQATSLLTVRFCFASGEVFGAGGYVLDY